jgi:TonB family protein
LAWALFPYTPRLRSDEEPTDGVRFGPYVLLEKIATGGMAEVWKARKRGEEGFQKIVAIKKILPHLSDNQDFIEMFVDEAKLAAQLNHNNIIHIYDLGKIGTSYYIAMEYIDGNDLKTILRRGQERDQTLGVELALFVASKIAAALDYAHRKRGFDEKDLGLVHRDVSPQNVLISHEGDIKLCDFGIAKAASKASHTHAGALKGKLQYMSPEQAWGRSIDRRSDIFALAVVLFEMLTNRKLFLGENELSVLDQVREARVIAPSEINDEVPSNVDAIVLKGLAKEPADRYQTAGEMAKDIEAVLFDFRPTPTSADLAIFMHRLWSAQPLHMPEPEPVPVPVVEPEPRPARVAHTDSTLRPAVVAAAAAAPAADAPAATVPMPAWDAPPAPVAESRRPLMPLMFVAAMVLAIVGGFFYVRSRSGSVDALPVTQAATVVPSATAASTPAETGTIVETTNTALTSTLAAVDTAAFAPQEPVLDPGLVQQEVQRRLAAERARLDEQARAQTATVAQQPAPVVQRPTPQPQVATQTVPPPVQQPAPVTDTTPAQTAANPPAVAQPATDTTPAPAVVREGDLVPSGTPGLVPARVLRRATVPYPPIARAQKIAGTVICSVLVSETGDVLDVRIIRGINRPVGLNEAAEAMMRRSSFSPPTKDGVRVKAWTTVPVDFRL